MDSHLTQTWRWHCSASWAWAWHWRRRGTCGWPARCSLRRLSRTDITDTTHQGWTFPTSICCKLSLKCVACAHGHVVDAHAADGAAVVAEVVLDGWVGHLWEAGVQRMRKSRADGGAAAEGRQTFSSSNRRVKCRMWANWRASACFCSSCCVGVVPGRVRTSSRERKLDSVWWTQTCSLRASMTVYLLIYS